MKHDARRRVISLLGQVWSLAAPYWRSEERWRAGGLLAAIIALTLGLVYILVLITDWNRLFYNALEAKDFAAFQELLLRFCGLVTIYIAGAVAKLYLTQSLEINWRTWLTRRYVGDWLADRAYYRLELQGRETTDNPDQRIADDLRLFTAGALGLSLGLFSSVVTLVSFVAVLWSISGALTVPLGQTEIVIPGYMVWAAIGYAVIGSLLTHLVGRRLVGLNFQQERYEADFRFGLVRLRENAEGVALYRGEEAERLSLLGRFDRIRGNWRQLMRASVRLATFTTGYNQIAIIFPILVAAPQYFAGAITLGGLMQISSAFGRVAGRALLVRQQLRRAGALESQCRPARRLQRRARSGGGAGDRSRTDRGGGEWRGGAERRGGRPGVAVGQGHPRRRQAGHRARRPRADRGAVR